MAEVTSADRITAIIRDVTGSMVAVGKNIFQLRITFNIHGVPVFRLPSERRPQPRLRQLPVQPPPPRPFPNLLDRQGEVGAATAALQMASPVQLCGDAGTGKTVLIQHLAYHAVTANFPDGVVYYRFLAGYQSSEDLLQVLFDTFYEFSEASEGPVKLADGVLRHYLRDRQALVLLDDAELARDDAEGLINAVPRCTFFLASQNRSLWTDARVISLHGLPLDAALKLLERGLERPLSEEERPAAETLCTALVGHPMRILWAALLIREQGRLLDEVARDTRAVGAQALTAEILASLTEPERRVLRVLAALRGATVQTEHLTALTQLPDAGPVLDGLYMRYLVRAHSPRYSLSGPLDQVLQQDWDLTPWADRALTYFANWAEANKKTPSLLTEEADAVLGLLEWGVRVGRSADVLRLGRAVEGALALSLRWGAWAQALHWALHASRALKDQASEAWALHQLGTRALCLDDTSTAYNSLTQALKIREALGDQIGAAVTRHNLDLLLGPPPPQGPAEPPAPPAPKPARVPILRSLVAVLSVLALSAGGVAAWHVLKPKPPLVSLSTDHVSFDSQDVTVASGPRAIELTNVGTTSLTVSSITLTGDHPQDFRIVSDTCSRATIAPGNKCAIRVSFVPGAPGGRSATLRILDNARGSPRAVELSGTATVAQASLSIQPVMLDFSEQIVGRSSEPRPVVLANQGKGPLVIRSLAIEGAHAADFRITADGCTRAVLTPRRQCTVSVAFTPTTAGSRRASLTIAHDGPSSPRAVPLGGLGTVPEGLLAVRPLNLDFGEQWVGRPSRARSIVLANQGPGPLRITDVTREGRNAEEFPVLQRCSGKTLAPREECTLTVSFTPKDEGYRNARLTIASESGSRIVEVGGVGKAATGAIAVKPSILNFGDREVGTAGVPQTITLTNVGSGPVMIRSVTKSLDAGGFAVKDECTGIALTAGRSCTIAVSFTPRAEGNYTSSLTITHSASGSPRSIQLIGSGTAPTRVNPARILDFTASPAVITRGGSTRLCWSVVDARSVRIDPEVRALNPDETRKGCRTVRPVENTTYTLAATGHDGRSVSRQAKVTVEPIAAAPKVIRVTFPSSIPANGTRISGQVDFEDLDGDVNLASFEVVRGRSFSPFSFDPGVRGRPAGSFPISLSCNVPGDVILRLTLSDAAGNRSQPRDLSFTCLPVAVVLVPSLISPAEGAVLDNGCTNRSDTMEWEFRWSEVPGATNYHLYVYSRLGSNPVDEPALTSTSYRYDAGRNYIEDRWNQGWRWRVRARVNGVWQEWSPERTFTVEPVNTDCPVTTERPPSLVPSLLSPAEGALMDNGCTDQSDPMIWEFAWSEVPGATSYHLYVRHRNAPNPAIDNANVTSTSFRMDRRSYVGFSSVWFWRVRATVGGVWQEWSPERNFNVEPVNTDCPAAGAGATGPGTTGSRGSSLVPTLSFPLPGAVMDNGCTGGRDGTTWTFQWSPVPGADTYHLLVYHPGAQNPLINASDLKNPVYQYNQATSYIVDRNRLGWRWRVRARVNGVWQGWSAEQAFDVEPLNTDCP